MNTVDHHTERCFIIKFFSGCISNVMIETQSEQCSRVIKVSDIMITQYSLQITLALID